VTIGGRAAVIRSLAAKPQLFAAKQRH